MAGRSETDDQETAAAATGSRWEVLATEARHRQSGELDRLPGEAIVQLLLDEDRRGLEAARQLGTEVARAAAWLADSYAGGGTSGRLGVVEAAECPPTFGTDPARIRAVLAGGPEAVQSGQPWETLNPDYYRCLDPVAADRDADCRVGGTGSSSASYRFGSCLDPASGGDGTGVCPYPRAVNAGENTTDAHYQIDVNYTQNFAIGDRYNLQLKADVFNLLDKQTGYHIEADERAAGYGEPRSFFKPQRFQLSVRFEF